MLASTGHPVFAHSLFLFQARCSGAMWPCCDFTFSDDDEHNTDNNFFLLFADIGIMPNLLDCLKDVDVRQKSSWMQICPGHTCCLTALFFHF